MILLLGMLVQQPTVIGCSLQSERWNITYPSPDGSGCILQSVHPWTHDDKVVGKTTRANYPETRIKVQEAADGISATSLLTGGRVNTSNALYIRNEGGVVVEEKEIMLSDCYPAVESIGEFQGGRLFYIASALIGEREDNVVILSRNHEQFTRVLASLHIEPKDV
jgi:hypothetical protein